MPLRMRSCVCPGSIAFRTITPLKHPQRNLRVQMKCLTRIFHPNIDDTTGKICASFLDDTKWVPTHTILSMLQSMYVVMFQGIAAASPSRIFSEADSCVDPNGHDPLPDCKHAAELLLSNPEEFKRRVRRHMQEVPPFVVVLPIIPAHFALSARYLYFRLSQCQRRLGLLIDEFLKYCCRFSAL
jgi:ubiquitin-protein ligase